MSHPSSPQQDNSTNTTEAPTDPPTNPPTDPPVPFGPYTVTYKIEYADEDCFMQENLKVMEGSGYRYVFDYIVPESIRTELTVQDDITRGDYYSVQEVMELAVDNNSDIYFSVLYKGSDMGYFVKGIGEIRSNIDCMWFFYYRAPNMEYPFLKTFGVSKFDAEPNSTIVMRYQYPPIHAVYYEIEFPHPTNCTLDQVPRPEPLTISLYFGAPNYTYSVQKVMELAVDMDPSYEFIVTYYGKRRGYEIDAINGTENHDECTWHFFYIPPRTARESANNYTNISYFNVEANSTILMSFQVLPKPPPEPTEAPTEEPTPSSSSALPLPEPTETPTASSTPSEPEDTSSPTTLPMMTTSSESGSVVPLINKFALILSLIACAVYSLL